MPITFRNKYEAKKHVIDHGVERSQSLLDEDARLRQKNQSALNGTDSRKYLIDAVAEAKADAATAKADLEKSELERSFEATNRSIRAAEDANKIAAKALRISIFTAVIAVASAIAAAASAIAALRALDKEPERIIIHAPAQQALLPPAAPKLGSTTKEKTHRNAQAKLPGR